MKNSAPPMTVSNRKSIKHNKIKPPVAPKMEFIHPCNPYQNSSMRTTRGLLRKHGLIGTYTVSGQTGTGPTAGSESINPRVGHGNRVLAARACPRLGHGFFRRLCRKQVSIRCTNGKPRRWSMSGPYGLPSARKSVPIGGLIGSQSRLLASRDRQHRCLAIRHPRLACQG